MPFTKGDSRAAEAGRAGMRNRWRRASAEDRAEANRVMREAQAANYRKKAGDALARLGMTPSLAEVEQAATALHRADLGERLASARQARWVEPERASPASPSLDVESPDVASLRLAR